LNVVFQLTLNGEALILIILITVTVHTRYRYPVLLNKTVLKKQTNILTTFRYFLKLNSIGSEPQIRYM